MKRLFLSGLILVLSIFVLWGASFAGVASPIEPSSDKDQKINRSGLPSRISTRQSAYIATVTPIYTSQTDRLPRFDFLPKILRQEDSRN